jgi:hypothetical protein
VSGFEVGEEGMLVLEIFLGRWSFGRWMDGVCLHFFFSSMLGPDGVLRCLLICQFSDFEGFYLHGNGRKG